MSSYLNLDCMDVGRGLPSMPDNYYDLAIVDPPYGLPKASTRGSGKLKNSSLNKGKISEWDIRPNEAYWRELMRVSRHQIIWGGNYFPLPPTRCWLIWDKQQPFPNFAPFEMAWTSFDCHPGLFSFNARLNQKAEVIHGTQKPEELYEWMLSRYAQPGWRLLDTHVGSASSLVVFERFGFEYDGYELNEGIYQRSRARLKESRVQKSLFTGQELFKMSQKTLFD